jgi:tRNA pseudouridine55 synthase
VARWDAPVLSLRIQCGSGTYIRSIARDLGRALGTVAHLSGLVRLRVGPFGIARATGLDELEAVAADGAWPSLLFPLDIAAADAPAIVEDPSRSLDLHYGRRWRASARPSPDHAAAQSAEIAGNDPVARVYAATGDLLGIVKLDAEGYWQPTLGLRPTVDESVDDER